MGSIVHRSVPTNLRWFPTCSHAHAMFQDRFKDVQVGSRWFSTLYILSPNFHNNVRAHSSSVRCAKVELRGGHCCCAGVPNVRKKGLSGADGGGRVVTKVAHLLMSSARMS